MKTKYIISLFIVGTILLIVGSLFKIMHWPYASQWIITGAAIQVVAALLSLWKVLTTDQFKDFLNS